MKYRRESIPEDHPLATAVWVKIRAVDNLWVNPNYALDDRFKATSCMVQRTYLLVANMLRDMPALPLELADDYGLIGMSGQRDARKALAELVDLNLIEVIQYRLPSGIFVKPDGS